jgi:hypothetical protein
VPTVMYAGAEEVAAAGRGEEEDGVAASSASLSKSNSGPFPCRDDLPLGEKYSWLMVGR